MRRYAMIFIHDCRGLCGYDQRSCYNISTRHGSVSGYHTCLC